MSDSVAEQLEAHSERIEALEQQLGELVQQAKMKEQS